VRLVRALMDWLYGFCIALVSAQRELDETERMGRARAELMRRNKP